MSTLKQTVVSQRAAEAQAPSAAVVAQFGSLPDDALLRQKHIVPDRKHPDRATLLQISAATMWRWVSRGMFPAPVRIGRTTAWRVGDLRAWMASQTRGQ